MNKTLVVWNLWDQMVQQGRPYRRHRPPRLLQQVQSLWNPLFLHHHHDGNNNDQKNSSSSIILTTKYTTTSSSFSSSSSSRFPISAMHIVTPDMITVTNAIGALNHMMIDNNNDNNNNNKYDDENDTNHKEKDISFVDCVMDQIYCDAVELMCSSSSCASGNGNIRSSTTTATLPVLCVTKDKNTKKRHPSSSSSTTTTSSWEVDLSGLSLPIARAACRHIFLQNILQGTTTTTTSSSSRLAQPTTQQEEQQQKQHQGKRKSMGWNTKLSPIQFRNLILRTGVGRANKYSHYDHEDDDDDHHHHDDSAETNGVPSNNNKNKNQNNKNKNNMVIESTTSLRSYVQTILNTDFNPPIESHIPSYAPGTVHISSDMIQYWVQRQARHHRL